MRKPHKILLVVLLSAGAAIAGVVIGRWLYANPTHHFQVVREGVLYRGAQPDAWALRRIVAQYHVRTVVNLRGESQEQSWWVAERDFCAANGIRLVNIPIDQKDFAAKGLKEFLTVVTDPDNQPVFVHCEVGSVRTGFAVAAYRIAVQGWSYQDAIAEARRLKFRPENDDCRRFDGILRRLASGADWRSIDKVPDEAATRPASRP